MAESDETARAIVAGQTGSLEVVKMALSNVCFGSEADIEAHQTHVRFTPKSGHCRTTLGCPLWVNSGHRRSEPCLKMASLRAQSGQRPDA
jgi:hypothetical protein